MPLSESQRLEFEEYLETILDLYSKDEYESDVENIGFSFAYSGVVRCREN